MAALYFQQPADTASSVNCTVSVIVSQPVSFVSFYVSYAKAIVNSLVGVSSSPMNTSAAGSLYAITFDSTVFSIADGYIFTAVATTSSGTNYTASKVVRIDNTGPAVALSVSPAIASGYLVDNLNNFTVSTTFLSGTSISSVSFYVDQAQFSAYIGSVSFSPYIFNFSLPGIGLNLTQGTIISIRTVVLGANGHTTVSTLTGVVKAALVPPTAIGFTAITTSSSGPAVAETIAPRTVVGFLSTTGTNPFATYVYKLSASGSDFNASGSTLLIANNASFSYYVQNVYTFNVTTTDSYNYSYTAPLTIYGACCVPFGL